MKLIVLSLAVSMVTGCSPPRGGFKPLSFEELLPQFDMVILGKTINQTTSGENFLSSNYSVLCVLKGDGNEVPENIVLGHNPCLTPTEIGTSYILGVRRMKENKIEWASVNATGPQLPYFEYTKENREKVLKFCSMRSPTLPNGLPATEAKSSEACPEIPDDGLCTSGSSGIHGLFNLLAVAITTPLSCYFLTK